VQDLDYERLAKALIPVAQAAGSAIMRHYRDGVVTEYKDNWSPVTAADRDAEAIILAALARILPGVPVVAEEEAAAGRIPATGAEFLLVDPLDGTREFVNKRDEFTVNIALIRDRKPVFGLVYAPATKGQELYVTLGAGRCGEGRLDPDGPPTADALAGLKSIRARPADMSGLVVLASRSHMDDETKAFIARHTVKETRNAGSSLKFCVIARGDADLYPRFGPTMEWDTAAGHAVLAAAGGEMTMLDGTPFLYGKTDKGYLNPGFLAWGRRA
jgi:3'(2'), 5'-bisphosphate nucleotidase